MNYEDMEAYALGTAGAVQGFIKYGSPAARAWAVMGVGILGYEVMCPKGETLSEGVDRALEQHKLLTLGGIA